MNKHANMSPEEIRRSIDELGEWFHNIDIVGVPTAPHHFLGDYPRTKWARVAPALPSDLRGSTVLDIGCNAGFHSIEMKRRGADRVVGIDTDERYLAQARFAADRLGVELELEQMSVYEIGRLRERFDLVLFMGVLYHLRHPLLALDLIHEHVSRDLVVVQSMLRGSFEATSVAPDYPFAEQRIFDEPGYPKLHFVESLFAGDPTNWWVPNRACLEAMLRSSGFEIVSHPEAEVFVCRRGAFPAETQAAYAASGAE
ncbi:MAG TPA: TIGR04290 family methyltransferase [Polyangia bacterium]|nr:TIGR04290 family methyltransferase [Polyangia bacterium]